ncbi:Hypothetical predicted protein [Podarcis lilfordi]|uniref:Uncharacterized protein n=1 Tax=Podarcis lilfordi TaxID=74358 RepID=A0AA35P6T5_9SAUR|nr:Hypothetical predicted protein [Podarcis lilfordi]
MEGQWLRFFKAIWKGFNSALLIKLNGNCVCLKDLHNYLFPKGPLIEGIEGNKTREWVAGSGEEEKQRCRHVQVVRRDLILEGVGQLWVYKISNEGGSGWVGELPLVQD